VTLPADKIPKHHGELYFEPDLPLWKEEALRNRERLVKETFWGQSAYKVRSTLKLPNNHPLVLSGHQPVFFHPGLWAKCLAASTLAESLSGTPCHKITDTSLAPEHLHYLPEVEENGKSRFKQLDFFRTKDMKQQEKTIPYAYLPAPELAALEHIFTDSQVYSPELVKPRIAAFWGKFTKGLKKEATWYDFHLHSLKMLDEICGTRRNYLQASKIWSSEPFIQFTASWLSNLPEMTESYNKSLDEYRAKYGITHDLTPMPNLKFENWWTEIPFWGVTKYHQRHSLWAKKEGKHLMLKMKGGDGTFSLDHENIQAGLGTLALSLWPKAIPQTLFCRLFLCDFFVHGIGGAAYEEVGDMLFSKVFKLKPLAYGVVSGTYLVDPEESRVVDVIMSHEQKIEWWGRALAQNPEYLFTHKANWEKELPVFMHQRFQGCLKDPALRKLAEEKVKLVEDLKNPAKKEGAAKKIKEVNFALYDGYTEVLKALEQGLMDVNKVKDTREVLGYREYPFFCFPPELFVEMKDKIREAAHADKTTPAVKQ
jgi:hypothetical protein